MSPTIYTRIANQPTRHILVAVIISTIFIQLSLLGSAKLSVFNSNSKSSSAILADSAHGSTSTSSIGVAIESNSVPLTSTQPLPEAESSLAGSTASASSPTAPLSQETTQAPSLKTYKIKPGDNLSKVWGFFGAPYAGSLKAHSAIKDAKLEGSSLRVGEELEIELNSASDIILLRKKLKAGRIMELRGSSQDGYQVTVIEPTTTEVERRVTGSIYSSFSHAALSLDLPPQVIDDFVDLFGGQVEFGREIQPGAAYTVIYSELIGDDGETLAVKSIRAASLSNNGRTLTAVLHAGKDGVARYFDANGEQLGRQFLRYPLQFSRISSVFAQNRFHPVLGKHRPHNGVDFAAPIGTPVRAVGDGVIEFVGYRGGAGLMISIKHCDRYRTEYMHLSRATSSLRPGARISRGDVIGAVGMTGLSTGPHLHFGLFDRGKYVDPLKAELPTMPTLKDRIPSDYLLAMVDVLKAAQASMVMARDIVINSDSIAPTA